MKILFLLITFISLNMSAQTTITAKFFEYKHDKATETLLKADCDSFASFDFIVKNFHFPPKIEDNIVYHKNKIANNDDNPILHNGIYNLFDSLNRLRTYFYEGNMLSGRIPLSYVFEYDGDSDKIIKVVKEIDFSYYDIIYEKGLIIKIEHKNLDKELMEELIIIRE